jgi:pimeloyl-ACP methyl ester carboxylesterase
VRVDEHTIELAGSPVFYRSAPVKDPPALFLHGIPTSSDDWAEVLARTGGIAPDLPGFGRSGKGGHLDYSLAGETGFLEALLDHLGLERVQLVLHDWGAGAGLSFAQRHPERVERIALVNALPLLPGFHWHRLARIWRRPLVGELAMGCVTRRVLARALRGASASADAWPDERVLAAWEQFDQGTQRAILRLHRSASEAALATAGEQLSALRCPALVLWGERDPWLPAEFAAAYGQRLSSSEVRLLPQAGHWPWLEQPDVVGAIAAFLSPGT